MKAIDINANHLVLGFGATGISIVRTLITLGVKSVWAMDNRPHPPNKQEINKLCSQVINGQWDQALLSSCDYLWLSPGIPLYTPELAEVLSRLPKTHIGGDIELFAHLIKRRVIGITGTNGKSTVTSFVGTICKEAGFPTYMGGNLGEPALDLWLRYQKDNMPKDAIFVLELSSFQLETTAHLELDVATILNIAPDHLDRYDSYEHYWRTKFKIFEQSYRCISNLDDSILECYSEAKNQIVEKFSLKDRAADWYFDRSVSTIFYQGEKFVSLAETTLGGLHNLSNLMVGVAIAHNIGIDKNAIETGIRNYQSLPHRCVLVRDVNGVRYYNDSKATNLASTEAAILGFPEPKWLILGGDTKGQDFSSLATLLLHQVKGVYLIGLSAEEIVSHIPEKIPYAYVKDLNIALDQIYQQSEKGDVVLFSPACASLDQYKNFEARGEAFSELVKKL